MRRDESLYVVECDAKASCFMRKWYMTKPPGVLHGQRHKDIARVKR